LIRVVRRGGRVVVSVDGVDLELSAAQAYVLARQLGSVLGLRVSLGRPIVSASRAPGGVEVTLVEGGGARRFFVPGALLDAYVRGLRRLGPGRHAYPSVARALLSEARAAGFAGRVERYLEGAPEDGWERLFGARTDYYELFRVPLLVLEEQGCVEAKRRYVLVRDC